MKTRRRSIAMLMLLVRGQVQLGVDAQRVIDTLQRAQPSS